MSDERWPDVYGPETISVIACPRCWRPTHYALNTDRYVCAIHGPAVTGQMLPRYSANDSTMGRNDGQGQS